MKRILALVLAVSMVTYFSWPTSTYAAIALVDSEVGELPSNVSSAVITLPTYSASDYLILVVERNQVSSSWTGDGSVAVSELSVGTRRLSILKLTVTGTPTTFTLTASGNGIWRWWVGSFSGVDGAAVVNASFDDIGSNTTAAMAVPSTSLSYTSNGSELAVYAGGVNATASWTSVGDTLYASASGNAALHVLSKPVGAGLTTVTYTALDRGLEGTTRNESVGAVVLQAQQAPVPLEEAKVQINAPTILRAPMTIL